MTTWLDKQVSKSDKRKAKEQRVVKAPRIDFNAKSMPHTKLGRKTVDKYFVVHTAECKNYPGTTDLEGMYRYLSRTHYWVQNAIDIEGNYAKGADFMSIVQHVAGANSIATGCELIGFAATTHKEWLTSHKLQLLKLSELIAYWSYKTGNKINGSTVKGHRDFPQGGHSDPGKNFPMRRLRRDSRYYKKHGEHLPQSEGGLL